MINKPKNLVLTKKWIDDNLFRSDGNLNVSRLRWWEIDAEEVYLTYNGLVCPPRCKHPDCWNQANYSNFKNGYVDHCSNKCATSGPIRLKRTKASCQAKFGVDNAFQLEKVIQGTKDTANNLSIFIKNAKKRHDNRFDYSQTIYDKNCGVHQKVQIICRIHGVFTQKANNHTAGGICPRCALIRRQRKRIREGAKPLRLTHYRHYTSLVDVETSKNESKVKNIEKRSLEWHLDHKFSKRKGFEQGILPYVIGSYYNLEIISQHDNTTKHWHCSITLNELYNEMKEEK